ncbi:MAG: PorV/PorQ family protein [Elusimicrobiota bacterium]
MKRIRTVPILLLLLLPIHSRCDDWGLPGRYLSYGVGARALAMGNAFVGLADDVSSIYWNPSATVLAPHGVSLFYQQLFLDTNYNFIGYVLPPTYLGSVGIGIVSLNSYNIEGMAETNESSGEFSNMESALFCSYGYQIDDNLSLGVAAKLVRQKISSYEDLSYGMDVGALYSILKEKIILGVNIQNVLSPVILLSEEKDVFPLSIRSGLAIRLLNNNIILTTDATKQKYQSVKLYNGVEFGIFKKLFVRAGLYNSNQLTSGFGIKLDRFGLDYAFANQGLGNSHKFSINYNFSDFVAKIKYNIYKGGWEKFLRLSVKTRENIKRWKLTVLSQKNNIIKIVDGTGAPSEEIIIKIEESSDKYYNCELLLISKLGHTKTIHKKIKL